MQKLLRYICEKGFEHHVVMNFSTVAPIVHEAATSCYFRLGNEPRTATKFFRPSSRTPFALFADRVRDLLSETFVGTKTPRFHWRNNRRRLQVAIVAGVDFGTLSVRVTIVDTMRVGDLGSGVAEYPLHRRKDDPDFATQSHEDHMRALAEATRKATASAKTSGDDVAALAIDTTGSSVIPVGANPEPLDDYYLWCDHRAAREAALRSLKLRIAKSWR